MAMAPRVLVVEDEKDLSTVIAYNLRADGLEVIVCDTGEAGIKEATTRRFDLVVLDLMLPDMSGLDVVRKLKANNATREIPILIASARGEEVDRVVGLELGADDYVVKPFSVRELVMRVKGLAVRARERRLARAASDEGKRLRWRGLELDPVRHRVTVDHAELGLRPLEYKLLAIFIEHPGRVFSRTELLQEVWGISPDTNTRTVDTHIRRLRERLGIHSDAIETVHGFGYRLRDPA